MRPVITARHFKLELNKSLQDETRECQANGYLLSAKKIGMGAFSRVYLAYATQEKLTQNYKLASDLKVKHHNMVAIKVVSIKDAPLEYSRKFLFREIYALNATYKHANVIQLYETFRTSKRCYLVLELASRGDLLEHINMVSSRKGIPGLTEDEARRIFRQIVSAVDHCHKNHIVHRDLKCENILLDQDGFVKLTDFGFANKCLEKQALMDTFCGSVAYTAPEILLARKYHGEYADLWSLGVILFAMVTGKLPFNERNPRKLVQLIKKGLESNSSVSEDCWDLINSLLQWKPSDRLGVQEVVKHSWMHRAKSSIFHRVWISNSEITNRSQAQERKPQGLSLLSTQSTTCKHKSHLAEFTSYRSKMRYVTPSPRHSKTLQMKTDPEKKLELFTRRSGGMVVGRVQLRSLLQAENMHQGYSPKHPSRVLADHPRPPSAPRPFYNLPNFRKPGSASSHHSRSKARLECDKMRPGSCRSIQLSQRENSLS
ncbi:testis-specific serine/threonine-protein kinase 5-like [Latimeria chalumnae]|uniref:testis-specific serine/threonine-protein kinase 5-like n=1 Tax=Latimeria chalumnae TaxID=7897 RepID=UPI00313CEE6F